MQKLEAGESLPDIRADIDRTYSQFGPPTDTELP
jgi:hypothetical protein